MKAFGLAVGLCAVMLFGAAAAQAAPEFYVSITGVRQGPFPGEVIRKGFEGKIAGLSFDYSVVSPRDSVTGQITVKRQHRPIRIKKAVNGTFRNRKSPLGSQCGLLVRNSQAVGKYNATFLVPLGLLGRGARRFAHTGENSFVLEGD